MTGSFIVLEGTDSSGKKTQLDLLAKRLSKEGYQVKTLDFPRYQGNAFGKLAGRFLNGEFGKLDEISPYLAVLPYMIDQYLGGQEIKKWVDQGKLVVTNRYFTSNVHQIAKFPKGEKREAFRRWLWPAGWKEFGIYKPDLIIVLLVPPSIARELTYQKGQRAYLQEKLLDIAEASQDHQSASYEDYKHTAGQEKDWLTIDCLDRDGKLKPPRAIHQEIWSVLADRKIVN